MITYEKPQISAPIIGTPNKLKSMMETMDDFRSFHVAALSPKVFASDIIVNTNYI